MVIELKNRKIGPGYPTFIVAEMSCNHLQKYNRALRIIDATADAGVDAVKLQTFRPETITMNSSNKWFQITKGLWRGQTLYDLYKKTYTPWEWQSKLKRYAEKKGLILFSSPFDENAVDFLEQMNVDLYKVASFELVDIGLLKKIAQTKKPVILSRGMASVEEISIAVKTLKENGTPQIVILHCVSSYPAKSKDMNLATIPDIARRFGVLVGLSDHTLSPVVPIVAVSLGASIIEKHLTISRKDGGPDADFSLEPSELKILVKSVREAEKSIGKPTYSSDKNKSESQNIQFRRSLFVVEDIAKGDIFTHQNIKSIRPGYGMSPINLDNIIGKKASIGITSGTPLSHYHIVDE